MTYVDSNNNNYYYYLFIIIIYLFMTLVDSKIT